MLAWFIAARVCDVRTETVFLEGCEVFQIQRNLFIAFEHKNVFSATNSQKDPWLAMSKKKYKRMTKRERMGVPSILVLEEIFLAVTNSDMQKRSDQRDRCSCTCRCYRDSHFWR
jgi:hypothetical protein